MITTTAHRAAVATFVTGKVFYKRGSKPKRVKIKTVFKASDLVYTRKGKVNIQFGNNSIIRLKPHTTVRLGKGFSEVSLRRGVIFAKVRKGQGVKFAIRTAVGKSTDKKIKSGVYVNKGEVAVQERKSKKSARVKGGRQVVASTSGLIDSAIGPFIRGEMKIFKTLQVIIDAKDDALHDGMEKGEEVGDDLQKKGDKILDGLGF